MNCYTCQRGGSAVPAVAICQGCGAGCCLDHLEERITAGRPAGLTLGMPPRIELFCLRCLALQSVLAPVARCKMAATVKSAARNAPALPNEAEAISTVEALLRGEHLAPEKETSTAKGWRRLLGWRRTR